MTGNSNTDNFGDAQTAPPRRCAVCSHQDRASIEAALLDSSLRDVERRFGLTRSTLHKHRTEHMPEVAQNRRAESLRLSLNSAAISRRLEQLHAEAADLYAVSKGVDYSAAARALSVMQRQAEFAWRVAGSLPAGRSVGESRYEELAAAVVRMLEPHPELRAQMAIALRDIEERFDREVSLEGAAA